MRVFDNVRGSLIVLAATAVFVFLSSETAFSGKPGPPPPPQEPDWEFVPEEGGWVDHNTGLVWGLNAQDLFESLDPDAYVLGSWDFVDEEVLPAYRTVTEFNDWRFPTAAEVTDAASKNYAGNAFPNGVNAGTYQVVTWTSDGSQKWRVFGDLVTGETDRTIQERSFLNLTPVRRVTTP